MIALAAGKSNYHEIIEAARALYDNIKKSQKPEGDGKGGVLILEPPAAAKATQCFILHAY